MDFRWNSWNTEHVERHGISLADAEEVAQRARAPFPLLHRDDRYLVWGSTEDGRFLQVVFVMDPDDSIFIIHARLLTEREKKQFRRRKR